MTLSRFFGMLLLLLAAPVAFCVVESSSLAVLSSTEAKSLLMVGREKQLFVDHKFIGSSEGITLRVNPPYQTGEKLIVADQPWERGGRIASYGSVLKEEHPKGPRIRLWYDIISGGGVPGDGYRAVAYAESSDGIHFQKPILGLVESKGSKENNLVIPTDLSRMTVGGGSVFRDENPKCPPEKRYKSWSKLYSTAGTYQGRNRVWYSADGLRWHLEETIPTGLRAADTQPTWFWDPTIRRYRGSSREWVELAPGQRTRMAGYNESDNMLHWENFMLVLRADGRHFRRLGGRQPFLRLGPEGSFYSKWRVVA